MCHVTPLSPISMLFGQINMFLRKHLIENRNTDVAGGTSVLNILNKVGRTLFGKLRKQNRFCQTILSRIVVSVIKIQINYSCY